MDLPSKYKGFENMISAYFNKEIGPENIHVLNIYVDKQLERLYLKKGRLIFKYSYMESFHNFIAVLLNPFALACG